MWASAPVSVTRCGITVPVAFCGSAVSVALSFRPLFRGPHLMAPRSSPYGQAGLLHGGYEVSSFIREPSILNTGLSARQY